MSGADCSVNNNPLAQLNKHTQQNAQYSALSQNDLNGPLVGSSSLGLTQRSLKTKQSKVSERNLREINNFQNGMLSSGGDRNVMMPMKFDQIPMRAETNEQVRFHNVENVPVRNQGWSNEFTLQQNNTQSQLQQQHLGDDSILSNRNEKIGLTGFFQQPNNISGTMNSFRAPIFQNFNTRDQQQQRAPEQKMETNWDKQFGDLEKEVSENLKINDETDTTEEMTTNIHDDITADDVIIDDTYQSEFQKVWDDIHNDGEDFIPDRSKYMLSRMTGNLNYDFEDSKNEYLNNPNAYRIGCILMENGAKLSEAAMAFEAAVQEQPDHIDAWLKLGVVQIQNEKELNGICALEKCLKLDGKNLEAMKNLAISYINEGYDMSALTILNQWISTKYPDFEYIDHSILIDETLETNTKLENKIENKFISLSEKLPQVDPDVELCVGLLYYSDDNYDATIEHFNKALAANPNDELMWNRLGATLANSNRSEESIAAYHKALNLKPSFVRARYNLAVSCMNIGCFKESAEHLLTTLSMHEVEGEKFKQEHDYTSWNNDNIIETLKRVFVAMNRNDLLEKIKPGMDLTQFKGEFTF
ncbi:Peroxisomal membrane signal receptor PTS1 [Maudiozyma exigua]|uniref:Peroxisomal membrane signal receptor PTS1 n=1 Tax=Maudiozyma exigua TaxID=34358 RepID=A0A9P7BDB1_MAUEX|nr:Peroxisomal membrane signal receptor PTS1 [Kazachstania exigua]